MGAQCTCINNKPIMSDIFLNETKSIRYPLSSPSNSFNSKLGPSHIIKSPKKLSKMILLQSYFRGFLLRKKHFNRPYPYQSFLSKGTTKTTYIVIESSGIPQSDKDNLFKIYPPLNDGIPLEIIQISFPNQSEYYGEWNPRRKERHGRGIQLWLDKSMLIGLWQNDKTHGKGKFIHANGDYYEGDFVYDEQEGFGTYIQMDGSVYIGFWKKGRQEGTGKETWPDKMQYEGGYKNGKKSGKGLITFADGSTYEGDFLNNNMHGRGVHVYSNKNRYEGEMKYNLMDGEGVFTWNDGKKYVGHYTEGKKEGYGVFEWGNGKIYQGQWKKGIQHGEGEMYNSTEKIWKKGLWNEGKCVRWCDKN